MQGGLAGTPATAGFLNSEERQWLDDRQRASLVAREAEYARSSNAWGARMHLHKRALCNARQAYACVLPWQLYPCCLNKILKVHACAEQLVHMVCPSAAPLVSLRMWWLCIAWMLMGAAVTNLLVWTPLILEAALSGSFGGQAKPAAAQHAESLRDQVRPNEPISTFPAAAHPTPLTHSIGASLHMHLLFV